jgi:predicted MFS family arabinose efflux permease
MVLAFFCGAVLGAYGFSHLGFSSTIFLALILAILSIGPLIEDF